MSGDFRTSSTDGEGITNGIAISNWSVKQSNRTLTFSVWDFAGQTVYYNTHQFFLSHRAIYLLAWNMRHGYEHAGLDFWLSSIACHCPKAPVIIVGTHADEISDSVLPREQFLKSFTNIIDFCAVSAVTGQGVKDLSDRLIEVAMNQPYIGEMIPEAWLSLERSMISKRNQTSLLDWSSTEKLAQFAGIYGIEVKQAVYFLHDLGTLQYFDNDLLRDKVIINPQWIVDVMSCLVSANNKYCQNGRLRHKDIGSVWKTYPKDLHRWLLCLTEYFDLTFPLPEDAQSIIPCLLPPDEPSFDWPEDQVHDDIKEMRVLYTFEYLPAGLFNRAQVRLYEFSDNSVIWKTGSLLRKNDHLALMTQVGNSKIQVRVIGTRSDNIVLMLHEVIEGLISKFFTGIRYTYEIPCPSCIQANVKNLSMFSSKVLRRALELKPFFLQCHEHFHILSGTEVQNTVLPQSTQEFDVQLQRGMSELSSYKKDLTYDLFFMYCEADLPLEGQGESKVHPYRVHRHLEKEGYSCCYLEDLHQKSASDVAEAIQNSRLIVVFISDDFVGNPLCQRMFQFIKNTLKKDFILVVVGTGREWPKSEIGLQISSVVYVSLQNPKLYDERIVLITDQIRQKLKPEEDAPVSSDVFISYCWANSNTAVHAGDCRPQEGALGNGDPRLIKEFLHKNGISCWMDIEKVGKTGLFADISDGMKASKIVLACISNEYAKSENCKMEFRFAHISLKKPIILAVVGKGFDWESTEIGMLSLGYKKINFQIESKDSFETLLGQVSADLASVQTVSRSINHEQQRKAFVELFESLQRKLFRQLRSFVEDKEPFPHIFTIDFKDQPFDILTAQNMDPLTPSINDDELIDFDEIEETSDTRDLQQQQFCIKLLCEYEGGWHCAGDGLDMQFSRDDMMVMLEFAAPYFDRVLSILKHTDLDFAILKTEEGKKLMKIIRNWDAGENQGQIRAIYLALREYLLKKDKQRLRGSLKWCYVPSGKHLWLCEEHQQLPRVMVVSDHETETPSSEAGDLESEDDLLLRALRTIQEERRAAEEEDSSDAVMIESMKLKILKFSEYARGLAPDISKSSPPGRVSSSKHEPALRPKSGALKVNEMRLSASRKARGRSPSPANNAGGGLSSEKEGFGKDPRSRSPSLSVSLAGKQFRKISNEERKLKMQVVGLATAAGNISNLETSTACILL